eukprot:TRINITY_DN48049_c0_g1_i1.p1 TRINITY_DN48049_c0_g1~~TRINITY_DN48049_c0_g1_i1.p1  ORF type:complete len:360 (-),score=90.74 TRINITY_DN48049_c0_g1_i1:225-1304(-)
MGESGTTAHTARACERGSRTATLSLLLNLRLQHVRSNACVNYMPAMRLERIAQGPRARSRGSRRDKTGRERGGGMQRERDVRALRDALRRVCAAAQSAAESAAVEAALRDAVAVAHRLPATVVARELRVMRASSLHKLVVIRLVLVHDPALIARVRRALAASSLLSAKTSGTSPQERRALVDVLQTLLRMPPQGDAQLLRVLKIRFQTACKAARVRVTDRALAECAVRLAATTRRLEAVLQRAETLDANEHESGAQWVIEASGVEEESGAVVNAAQTLRHADVSSLFDAVRRARALREQVASARESTSARLAGAGGAGGVRRAREGESATGREQDALSDDDSEGQWEEAVQLHALREQR